MFCRFFGLAGLFALIFMDLTNYMQHEFIYFATTTKAMRALYIYIITRSVKM